MTIIVGKKDTCILIHFWMECVMEVLFCYVTVSIHGKEELVKSFHCSCVIFVVPFLFHILDLIIFLFFCMIYFFIHIPHMHDMKHCLCNAERSDEKKKMKFQFPHILHSIWKFILLVLI